MTPKYKNQNSNHKKKQKNNKKQKQNKTKPKTKSMVFHPKYPHNAIKIGTLYLFVHFQLKFEFCHGETRETYFNPNLCHGETRETYFNPNLCSRQEQ